MKLVITSHNLKSHALKALAEELSSQLGYKVYRKAPDALRRHQRSVHFEQGIDKVDQFRAFAAAGVSCPTFATTLEGAQQLESELVCVRTVTNGSEGRGLHVCNQGELTQQAPLYTAYIKKKKEFRVHVWNGAVIDIQQKKKKSGEETNSQIRNTANGYVFCRNDVVAPDDCAPAALAAVAALGRTYGAVDIIWNERANRCYVLEVNSRPGMEGTTIKKYADAIIQSI